MRDWSRINKYYDELLNDIYPQPMDEQHLQWATEVIGEWSSEIAPVVHSVLDVGCEEGAIQKLFESYNIKYIGIGLGVGSLKAGKEVIFGDFNFLPHDDNSFDLIFSRHTLEHSPFPLLTLMEWHRVAKKFLILVLPTPKYWTYLGRNHYSVMPPQQARWLLRRAGWKVMKKRYTKHELRFICIKRERKSYEGWAKAPVSCDIYMADKDDF